MITKRYHEIENIQRDLRKRTSIKKQMKLVHFYSVHYTDGQFEIENISFHFNLDNY